MDRPARAHLDDVRRDSDRGEEVPRRLARRLNDNSNRSRRAALRAPAATHYPHLEVDEVQVVDGRVRDAQRLAQRSVERAHRPIPLRHVVPECSVGQLELDGGFDLLRCERVLEEVA
jgi:hypothetical protein